ncbi:hypothetical protein C2G38_2159217 [Gigaspora rosea]|uniref:Uncharacterized protein n=1 Tax=Gigaspora rosea TaxID=44941 RepID=A0A397W1M8_9GLOM|nr:hypothetical protein C2G38_2159217 [Gigaspora rosea]
MVSCAAVKTKLETVSTSTKINSSTSDIISLCYTKVPLQYHTHLLLPTQQYSSIYTIEQEIYNEYELLLVESDNNLNTSTIYTNTIEETNTDSDSNSLEVYDPPTYYNKFLYYLRLQSLPLPQTVSSFLTYLQEKYSMFYSQQSQVVDNFHQFQYAKCDLELADINSDKAFSTLLKYNSKLNEKKQTSNQYQPLTGAKVQPIPSSVSYNALADAIAGLISKKSLDYKSMNSKQWQNFSDQVTQNLTLNYTLLSTNTTESLETTWHKIQTSIINAALQHILYKKFKVCNFQHNFSFKATKLYYNLKKLSNIIRQIKIVIKNQTSILLHLNQNINYINTQHQVNIPLLLTTHNLLPNWIFTTNLEWKALFYAHNIENTKEIRQQINNAISKRCNKLATNPTSMINSILNRYKDPVKFNNINTDTVTITEPHAIKDHIHNHFD